LKDKAIEKLIGDLHNVEGIPTDSESLETSFHQHGVNMRYLGEVAKQSKPKNFYHVGLLLEKEAVFRSFKHILNDCMRLSSETYLSSVIAHLLDILLAPFPYLELLDEGQVAFVDETIQNKIADSVKEEKVVGKKDEEKVEGKVEESENKDGVSKKDKKKNKKNKKKDETKPELSAEEKKGTGEFSDVLFKP